MMPSIRDSSLRSLLTRWCLAAWVVTQVVVGLGVFCLVDRFFWHAAEQQQQRTITSLWQRRPLFMESDYPMCPPPAKYDLPQPRHLDRPLEFGEWGPLFAQAVAVTSDSWVRLYGPNGEILYASGALNEVPELERDEVAKLMQWGAPTRSSAVTGKQERYHVLEFPMVAEFHHYTLGVLQVMKSSRVDDDRLRTLAGYIVLSCMLAFAIGYFLLQRIADVLSSPLSRLMETSRRVGGGDLDARTGLSPGRNEVFMLGAAFDRMAAQLKASFQAQSRFVADASHELKTPLTTIGGIAEVLDMADPSAPPERRKALKTLGREVDRMNALISDLLMLSQVEEAPERAEGSVPLHDLFEELIDNASMLGRTVECDCPELLRVSGPDGRLRRLFGNLLDNALHYTPVEGRITLRAHLSGGRVLAEVSDTGRGIRPESLPHIFERFYREDGSRCRRSGGTGLGLAIVAALARSLDGEVWVESAVGAGTTFFVSLPAR